MLLILVTPYAVVGAIAAAFLGAKRQRFKRAREALLLEPGVRYSEGNALSFTANDRTVRFFPFFNNSQLWRFEASDVPLGARARIHIASRFPGKLPAPEGLQEVHGLKELNARFFVWSDAPDVARAALSASDVEYAIVLLGSSATRVRFELERTGKLQVTFTGREHATTGARALFRSFHALTVALDAASYIEPLRLSAGGGASGAPISIPLGHGND